MATVSGILSISGYKDFAHPTLETKAPSLTVHQKIWTEVKTTSNGSYVQAELWVVNTGNTQLNAVSVTVTIQGGNGIWTPQFCDSSGTLLPDRYQAYSFSNLPVGVTSAVQKYWWKPSKPDVPQNGEAFDAKFTAIPTFTITYNDTDEYFTDTSRVTTG